MNITEATTKELVAFWNENSSSQIKKFADRKTAERRVAQLIAALGVPPTKSRSEGIAKSWLVPATAAKRAQRSGCIVDGVEFSSVPAAYRALEIPLTDCIQFRMLLKETGKQRDSEGRNWTIIPLNYK